MIFQIGIIATILISTFATLSAVTTSEQLLFKLRGDVPFPGSLQNSRSAFTNISNEGEYLVTAFNLNVRSGPSTEYEVRQIVSIGETFNIYKAEEDWAKVGQGLWVSLNYLSRIEHYDLMLISTELRTEKNTLELEIDILRPRSRNKKYLGRYRYGSSSAFLFLRGEVRGEEIIFTEVSAENEVTGRVMIPTSCINGDVVRTRHRLSCLQNGYWSTPNGDRKYYFQQNK